MDLIQASGQPRYGRFLEAPDGIQLDAYKNSFLSSEWQRRRRYKKFSFVAIRHQNLSVGFAIADLAAVGFGFYYSYDALKQQATEHQALQPLGFSTQVQEATTQPQFNYFKSKSVEIYSKQTKKRREILVRQQNKILCKASIELQPIQPLYLCSPNGVRGWTYTHKSMCLAVKGFVNHQGEQYDFNADSLASLDDTCGFLRPETEWFWLSCQLILDGQKIGINIASGVNESVGNENCLWIDGQLYALADVIFEPINANTWHIFSLDQQIDLTVKTSWRRYENKNFGLMASQFSQWIAEIDGTIGNEHKQVVITAAQGLLEQHYAKW